METGLVGRTTPATPAPKGTQWTEDGRKAVIWAEDILSLLMGIGMFAALPITMSIMGG